eukprot:11531568-Heterocapsa_arctica.AAC.1
MTGWSGGRRTGLGRTGRRLSGTGRPSGAGRPGTGGRRPVSEEPRKSPFGALAWALEGNLKLATTGGRGIPSGKTGTAGPKAFGASAGTKEGSR